MKKIFVAILLMVLVLTTVAAHAEYDWNGADIEATDVYVNHDGRHEMDFRIGDHWLLTFVSDNYYSDTAEWYTYCDGEPMWSDRTYTGSYEDDEYLDFVITLILNYYYDGMEL